MGLLSRIKKDRLADRSHGLLKRALDIKTSVEHEDDGGVAPIATMAVKKKPLTRF